MNQSEIKRIFRAWADEIDQQLDIIAHDGWDTGYIFSAIETILEDQTHPAVQSDPVAQHIIELAEKAQDSGQELMGPLLTILHIIDLYLHGRVNGFGYYIRLLTEQDASFAEITVKPDQTTNLRTASNNIEERLQTLLAEQPRQDSAKEYAEHVLQQLQQQLPIETNSEYSGPITKVTIERQGFVDGMRAHNQFLYSPNSECNALSYSSGETSHYYQLIKALKRDQLDKLCDLLLVDQQACRERADQLADRIKARSGEDKRESYFLSNLSGALGGCDREDFYRIYSEITGD